MPIGLAWTFSLDSLFSRLTNKVNKVGDVLLFLLRRGSEMILNVTWQLSKEKANFLALPLTAWVACSKARPFFFFRKIHFGRENSNIINWKIDIKCPIMAKKRLFIVISKLFSIMNRLAFWLEKLSVSTTLKVAKTYPMIHVMHHGRYWCYFES